MKKIIAIALAAAAALALFGCGGGRDVMKYGSRSINESQFGFEVALEKTTILSNQGLTSDSASFWSAVNESGETAAQAAMKELVKSESLRLYFADYAEKNGMGMTKSDKDAVDKAMNDFVKNFGSRSEFDGYMKGFGVDYDGVKSILELQYMSQKGQQIVFGSGGSREISDAKAKSWFNSNCASYKCVYVNNINHTYPNSKTVPLNEEQKQKAWETIDAVRAALGAGGIDALGESADYAVTDETVSVIKGDIKDKTLEEAVFGAKIGKISEVQCADGYYFIIRQAIPEGFLDDDKIKEIKTKLTQNEMDLIYESVKDKISIDLEALNLFSFTDSKTFMG